VCWKREEDGGRLKIYLRYVISKITYDNSGEFECHDLQNTIPIKETWIGNLGKRTPKMRVSLSAYVYQTLSDADAVK